MTENENADILIVLGASAGGLEALRALFSNYKDLSGASFLVVQHLSPTSKSMLGDLIGRDTKMQVETVKDKAPILAHRVYVTPPNYNIKTENKVFHLTKITDEVGPKPSIDNFLPSFAKDFGHKAVCVILSGTGSDGSIGVKELKAEGGILIAQNPQSAKYDGMPRSVISTNEVDYILNPEEIASELGHIAEKLNSGEDPRAHSFASQPYTLLLKLLEKRTGIDFSLYKPNTINRRINRRINATRQRSLESYYNYLQSHEEEVHNLFNDILISVTSFFRDDNQFTVVRDKLTDYIENTRDNDGLRLWSAGCATGEEAYSLAIVALEAYEKLGIDPKSRPIQVFATDIDERAMTQARKGWFASESLKQLETLKTTKYFTKSDRGYMIKKHVRDCVVFARHDLTNDPPFLRMDLVCCRNVFIYFEQEVQSKILKVFHYALNTNGILFLGKSETVVGSKHYFNELDSSAKVYERIERAVDPTMSFTRLKSTIRNSSVATSGGVAESRSDRTQVRKLVRDLVPDSIILDAELNVEEVYGNASSFLVFPDGVFHKTFENLLSKNLRTHLMTIVHQAKRKNGIIRSQPINATIDGESVRVVGTAHPVSLSYENKIILSFEMTQRSEKDKAPLSQGDNDKVINELQTELTATREHLQTVIQEQETTNEELQALNEELQSANEELQSTNEELETSNEELQSTNEELTTLNEELGVKSDELRSLSSHLETIQNTIENPIFVVDPNFNLVSVNRAAQSVFGVQEENIGKNFRLIETKKNITPICDVVEQTLKTRSPKQSDALFDGSSYAVRCQPIIDSIDETGGVVAILMDYTDLANALDKAENTEKALYRILASIPAKVSLRDLQGRYTFVNETFQKTVSLSSDEIIGKTDEELFGIEVGSVRRKRDLEALRTEKPFYSDEQHPDANDIIRVFHTARLPLVDEAGHATAICSVGVDISERAQTEKKLRSFQGAIAKADGFFALMRVEGRDSKVTFASEALADLCKQDIRGLEGKPLEFILTNLAPNLSGRVVGELTNKILTSKEYHDEFTSVISGTQTFYNVNTYLTDKDNHKYVFMALVDETMERARNLKFKQQEEEIIKAGRMASLGEMAAGIAHELKTPLNTIQGYLDLISTIEDQGQTIAKPVSDAVHNIEKTVHRISDIIVGLKSISKTKVKDSYEKCSVVGILNDLENICSFHTKNRGVELIVKTPDPDVTIEAKQTEIIQVLINLVNNAVDAVGSSPDKWIKVDASHKGGIVTFRVTDSGSGIPEAVAKQIMTPFFTTKNDGTGLGLSLSRNIVQSHNGDIKLDTTAKNTSFTVTLPLNQANSLTPESNRLN